MCEKIHVARAASIGAHKVTRYTGRLKIPPIRCKQCKKFLYDTNVNSQKSKKMRGEKLNYKGSDPTLSRRGIDPKEYEKESKWLELAAWQAKKDKKLTPIPNWLMQYGEYTNI